MNLDEKIKEAESDVEIRRAKLITAREKLTDAKFTVWWAEKDHDQALNNLQYYREQREGDRSKVQ